MPPAERADIFEALYRRHVDDVRRYASRRVASDDVDEAVAQTFELVWRTLERIPVGVELPWLYGTARRVIANQNRSERRRRRLVERVEALTPRSFDAADPLDQPPALEALAQLGEGDRELLCLVAWEGLEREELARALGISRPVLRLRLMRARRRFAIALEHIDAQNTVRISVGTRPRSTDV